MHASGTLTHTHTLEHNIHDFSQGIPIIESLMKCCVWFGVLNGFL